MKFNLVFEKTGDAIPFEVVVNHQLFEFFVEHIKQNSDNRFIDWGGVIHSVVKKHTNTLHQSIEQVNQITRLLADINFGSKPTTQGYLDQHFLNQVHCQWVHTQDTVINIDAVRFSDNQLVADIGNQLHDLYPDEIRNIRLAEALDKLGLLSVYEDINVAGVHRTEAAFNKIEYATSNRYDMFDNPFWNEVVTSNGYTNFSFGYTYLGREYYDKFVNFDNTLEFDDHFNFNKLEQTFTLSLRRAETLPFSTEFVNWAKHNNVKPIGTTVPIANIPDLIENLTKYRTIVYNNSVQRNKLTIEV
jgi:hypothetical protein